jgi:transcriptional adapter 2-alpha
MPGRLEFETEFFNEADERVKDMIFDDDPFSEDPGEVDLKLAVLDIYNHNLTKRAEKKRVIFEHGFLEHKKKQQWEKRWTKDDREIINKTKPLARLQNAADYDILVDGLIGMELFLTMLIFLAENKIRNRIIELQDYRRNGCITLEQGSKYDRDKAARVRPLYTMLILAQLNTEQFSILSVNIIITILSSHAKSSLNSRHHRRFRSNNPSIP